MRVIHGILYGPSDDLFCFCCHLFELRKLFRGVCVCVHGKGSYLLVYTLGDGQWLHLFDLLYQSWCLWAMQLLRYTTYRNGCSSLLQRLWREKSSLSRPATFKRPNLGKMVIRHILHETFNCLCPASSFFEQAFVLLYTNSAEQLEEGRYFFKRFFSFQRDIRTSKIKSKAGNK